MMNTPGSESPGTWLPHNEIHFVRLIRSDLTVNILNTELKVSPSLAHTYVEAVLLVNEHRLLIRQDGKTVQDFWFVMPVI